MSDMNFSEKTISGAAHRPSIVRHFGIEGLFGYRSISLDSEFAATVVIAKNGSGKTTLLGALDAILRRQFVRLSNLDFHTISLELRGISTRIKISKEDISRYIECCRESDFSGRAKLWDVEPLALLGFLESDFTSSQVNLSENVVFETIVSKYRYSQKSALQECQILAEWIEKKNDNIAAIRKILRDSLAGIDIVYLPTYRRIELTISDPEKRPGQRQRSVMSRLGVSVSGLQTGDIHFGLSDISERLSTLYREIEYQSNQGYGKVSASIINDLVTGTFEQGSSGSGSLPTREALQIFFARVESAERNYRFSPHFRIPDLDKIYGGEVPEESRKFLNYFLGQLNLVIQKTQDVESIVELFIVNCNRYLSGEDSSTMLSGGSLKSEGDDKELTFNRHNLQVSVSSKRTRKEIPLNSLSSGEKQMISLFAQLYLYPGKKIVLIDEPELSLSLDWQREILSDILSSPSCEQVVAITHSPFIFDNELEPYASSLRMKFDAHSHQDLFDGIDERDSIGGKEEGIDG